MPIMMPSMSNARPALFGDLEDINDALDLCIGEIKERISGNDEQYTDAQIEAMIGLIDHMEAIRFETDKERKIIEYRKFAKIINEDYARRFGKDQKYYEVDSALKGN